MAWAQSLAPAADDRARRCLVRVETKFQRNWVRGVGFFVSHNLVVTSTSAIAREDPHPSRYPYEISLTPFYPSRRDKVELVAVDRSLGLAFFRLNESPTRLNPFEPKALGPKAEPGATVFVPQDPPKNRGPGAHSVVELERSTLAGVVSGGPAAPTLFKLTSKADSRANGSPVLDAQGELLGISIVSERSGQRTVLPARHIWLSLQGRPLRALVREVGTDAKGMTLVGVSVPAIDPARRIKTLKLEVWTQSRADNNAKTLWPSADLAWDELLGEFVGQVRGLLPKGHALWARRIAIDARGERREFEAQRLTGVGPPQLPPGTDPAHLNRKAPPLKARRQGNPSGTEFDLVRSQTRSVNISGKRAVLAVEAPADGAEVYAITEGKARVLILDPVSLQPTQAIAVPRYPTDLWSDDKRLVVACREAGVILTLDRRTKRAIGSLSFRHLRQWIPAALLGRTPQGEFFSLWRHPTGRERLLISQDAQGRIKLHLDEQADRRRFMRELEQRRSLLCPGRPEGDLIKGFRTRDRRHRILPNFGHSTSSEHQDLEGVTFLTTPGTPLMQLPGQAAFLAWKPRFGGKRSPDREFVYVDRHTGEVVRRILSAKPASDDSSQPRLKQSQVVFVPHTERLVIWRQDKWLDKALWVIPCGPVAQPVEPVRVRIRAGTPPASVKVGNSVTYQVNLTNHDPKRKVVFKLRQGPYGATVDPSLGTFRWSPTSAMVGQWDIEVEAVIDGASLLVERWGIEVPKPSK